MDTKHLVYLMRSDLFRYTGNITWLLFIKHVMFYPGFKYSFLMRLCAYLQHKVYLWPAYLIARLLYRHYTFRYGISIPFTTDVGAGFFIGHFGGIVVHSDVKIGKNCNISHGVTLGQTNRGTRAGCPTIGNNVYIGPGAKVIGKIQIGSNVAIGANCVVIDDVPDNAVVVGVPGRIASMNGADGYVNKTWPDDN
jgi:serine O-acetyltransferase